MKRDVAAASLGAVLVATGVYLGATQSPGVESSSGASAALALVVLAAVVVALWKVRGSLDGADGDGVPWAPGEPFASPSPELVEGEFPLSSADLSRLVETAGRRARTDGDIEAGVAAVRPALRTALFDALVAGGATEADAQEALAEGRWTDDRVAASVLDESVEPPERSLRERVAAWLFPERVIRRQVRRAVDALAGVTDEALPTVPGQTAPRTVPVVRPTLSELRRGVDGRLQRAVDPSAVARGPLPPATALGDEDDGTGGTGDSETDREAGSP